MNRIIEDSKALETVVFREFNSVYEAEIVKSMLESLGVWATINNEYMSAFYPVGVIYAQVMVRRKDLERAKKIMRL